MFISKTDIGVSYGVYFILDMRIPQTFLSKIQHRNDKLINFYSTLPNAWKYFLREL